MLNLIVKCFGTTSKVKTKLRPNIPNLFIDEKTDVKTERTRYKSNIEKVDVPLIFFSIAFCKELD